MDIRRFGVGTRRPDGLTGSHGVTGQVIHTDGRAVISELAFMTRGAIEAHSSPNSTWFIVIEGGGFTAVGDESARIGAGDAVLWPAGPIHQAWTDGSHMRAIVVELTGADDAHVRGLIEATSRPALGPGTVERGEGTLAETSGEPTHDLEAGEPL